MNLDRVLTDASFSLWRSVCKVNTQDPENFDEELKSLVTAWPTLFFHARQLRTHPKSSSLCFLLPQTLDRLLVEEKERKSPSIVS